MPMTRVLAATGRASSDSSSCQQVTGATMPDQLLIRRNFWADGEQCDGKATRE